MVLALFAACQREQGTAFVISTRDQRQLARRRELATLRALGMPRSTLVLMLALEALWISTGGTLLGLGAGGVLAWCARRIGSPWLALPKEGAALRLAEAGFTLGGLAAVLAAVLGVTVLAALVPAIRAARHPVAAGLALIPACQEG
jgi:putative ABC transport system permease protein